ncbi:MAG: hypothetical protein U5K36_05265 [Roseovarius sp.]|nr:hypothetical protein [Roseovarius sp.]
MITFLVLMQGSFARAQNSGELLKLEMQLAPYLAAEGSLNDLCEDGDDTAEQGGDQRRPRFQSSSRA